MTVFSLTGDYMGTWGTQGPGAGQLLAVDGNGHVYVTDWLNHRIQVFGAGATPARSTTWGGVKAAYR